MFETEGANPTFSAAGLDGPTTQTITVQVSDGSLTATGQAAVEILNAEPTVVISGALATGLEGATINLTSTATDPGTNDTHTYAWSVTKDGSPFASGTNPTLSFTPDDNGDYVVTLTVTDDDGGVGTNSTTISVSNVVPTLSAITAPVAPVAVTSAVNVSATFTDPGMLDTHAALIEWGDGTSSAGSITEANGSGSVTGSHTYSAAGVYTITITLTDTDGGVDSETFQYVVVYDPSAGFVTGGGWITSPAGAYAADPILTGKATFGFVSKYQKGATVPSGNTEFQFQAAGPDLHEHRLRVAGRRRPEGAIQGIGHDQRQPAATASC